MWARQNKAWRTVGKPGQELLVRLTLGSSACVGSVDKGKQKAEVWGSWKSELSPLLTTCVSSFLPESVIIHTDEAISEVLYPNYQSCWSLREKTR